MPTTYTEDALWTFGRDNKIGMTDPSPCWVKRTNANEVTLVRGDRMNDVVQVVNASSRLIWQDPTELANETVRKLHNQIGSGNEFGYATYTQLGNDRRNTIVSFFDEDTEPNLWVTSLD